MAVKGAGRREFAELVSDHLLGHEHRNVLVPVVDAERQTHELRQNCRTPAPNLDDLGTSGPACKAGRLEQITVDERTLPDRSRHGSASLLAHMARCDDEFVSRLVRPGLLALGRLAPWAHWMPAAGRLTLAAAVRMIDRVHSDAAIVWTAPEPTTAAGLADRRIHVVGIRHRADRGETLAVNEPLLARAETQRNVALIAAHDLRVRTGRTGDRAALADLHLDIVDDRAHGNVGERHRIAGLHVDLDAGDHLVSGRQALRGDDVGLLTILIFNERNEAGAVGVVFQPLDLAHDIELATLEIDDAIGLFVTAAAEAHGDPASVVAATLLRLANSQRLHRLALVELAAVDDDELSKARGRRVECFERHDSRASQTGGHVDAIAISKRDDRLLHVLLASANAPERLVLAFAQQRIDRRHLDVEQVLDRRFDLRLGRVTRDLEHELVALGGESRLLRNHGSDDRVVMAHVLDHLNRASSASTAALVRTSFSRRMMS